MEIWFKINATLTVLFVVMVLIDRLGDVENKAYEYIGGLVTVIGILSWFFYFLVSIWL